MNGRKQIPNSLTNFMGSGLIVFFTILTLCNQALSAELEYRDTRTLNLSADALETFEIDTGAGDLVIEGSATASTIELRAEIEAHEEEDVKLTLEADGTTAKLIADLDSGFKLGWFDDNLSPHPKIDVVLTIPNDLVLKIHDGSGNLAIRNMERLIAIADGSGNIHVSNINGNVGITDDSGDIQLHNIDGTIEVEDGSGNLIIEEVTGLVTINDGSGDIDLRKLSNGIDLDEAGGGKLHMEDIEGDVSIR